MSEADFGKRAAEQGTSVETEAIKPVEIRFDPKKGTLLLGLGGAELIDPTFLDEKINDGFTSKSELHMTILGFKQGKQLARLIGQRPEILQVVESAINGIDWGFKTTNERYHLTKDYDGEEVPRESIVEMVDCPSLGSFIEQLSGVTGLEFEEQPPHVTLVTKGNPQGIGINTAQEILELGQRIS